MARKEEIIKATEEFLNDKDPNLAFAFGAGFMFGAEWSDEHPSEELLNKAWNRVWPMLENLGVCKESVEAEKELFFKALR